ncbi:mitogen-activated protein kinase kinase kinase [Malassezia cuniculi]|uniref:Mitogen-activated protein kinase kinase kinase n=1 Tax=Malassezia cuniculi TaxID=948313 RepID=A0AAF0J5M2_9BASI|nr:mitogen-activated protein kinase kinase kinase [Malassezia cuniculi]
MLSDDEDGRVIAQSPGSTIPGYFERTIGDPRRPVTTPAQLNTPLAELSMLDVSTQDVDPTRRIEWQTMLGSVLESEVLSSETRRIASADASAPSPTELMHRRWLELRAVVHGCTVQSFDIELSRLKDERQRIVPALIADIDACREDCSGEAAEEIAALIDRVDYAESLFSSQRHMATEFPAWTRPHTQNKLAALYSWSNTTWLLNIQASLLDRWTGVAKVDANESGESPFVERIFREGNLHETFERRTLHALRHIILKAKDTLRTFHSAFQTMALPSFDEVLTKLVLFPVWLAEGAIRLRLDYADKLHEPSVLLVESLFDDLRAAIALACRIKLQYTRLTVPDPDNGWDLPVNSSETFDEVLCSALLFFFKLLRFRLRSAPSFRMSDIIEPEWVFLCMAVQVVPGADLIVAKKTVGLVNRLFARTISMFDRELHDDTGPSRDYGTIFGNVRIHARKLMGLARELRRSLEIAAEYDLRMLRHREGDTPGDLPTFLKTLLDADYFLVYTSSFEERGIYILAEPSLHDKPDVIQDLLYRCIRPTEPRDVRGSTAVDAALNMLDTDNVLAVFPENNEPSNVESEWTAATPKEAVPPRYLLLISPRDAFLWTGRVMTLPMPWREIQLKDERLRLVADGPHERLEQCKQHFLAQLWQSDGNTPFTLPPIYERMAHLETIQQELKLMNKGVYVLSEAIVHAVPYVRHEVLAQRSQRIAKAESATAAHAMRCASDELVHTCFGIAAEQGARMLTLIESVRLRSQMSAALGGLAIEWIAFICDDCVPTERRTFKWAVAALENSMAVTQGENIFMLSSSEFELLKAKVSACMVLLISHFDVLGARGSAAKAQEELEKEREQRIKDSESTPRLETLDADALDAVRRRRFEHVTAVESAREAALTENRLIGRVLDDTRLEDRSLQRLASKGVQIRWQQGRFIGGGTFGTVYMAVNLDTGGLMAVKEIRFQELTSTPSLYKQILEEMNVMEMLRHPNIVEYYGIEVHRDKVYIFEEYCQGGSLAQLLEHGRIEDEVVVQVYALQMLDGLMYLHSKGVVHRDIKPENILLDHMGVIKFVDFGAAKVLSQSSHSARTRKPSAVAPGAIPPTALPGAGPAAMQSLQGTPMYMSPEMIKGENRGPHGAMDIWSLGCVLLECATGARPWHHLDNEWAIMFHIGMSQQHPPLPDETQLSVQGIDFIRRCLTIDPFERPTAIQLRSHPWICSLVAELEDEYSAEVDPDHSVAEHGNRSPVSNVDPLVSGDDEDLFSGPADVSTPSSTQTEFEAIIADKQYRVEEQQVRAMLNPDTPL